VYEDAELETSIICILFRDLNRIAEVSGFLFPRHFFNVVPRCLYDSIYSIWKAGDDITPFAVLELTKSKYGKRHDYEKFISSLAAHTYQDDELEQRARSVVKIYSSERLLRILNSGSDALKKGTEDVDSILPKVESDIRKLSDEESDDSEISTTEHCLTLALDQIERTANGQIIGVPTHIKRYNDSTGGLVSGEWTVLAGRPGTGKTTLAMDIMDEWCIEKKYNALFFSLEMGKEQLMNRLLAKRANVDLLKFRTGKLSQEEFSRIAAAAVALKDSSLLINDDPSVNTAQIFAMSSKTSNKLKASGKKLDAVVIDNLSILRPPKPSGSRISDITEMTRDIKIMAKKLGTHIIVLVHLNRNIEHRADDAPKLSDIRECGSIEQDADIISVLHKPDENSLLTNIHLLKNRGGPLEVIPTKAELKHMRFTDYDILF
jgi:replicative DNA helicase